ncbi:MAG: BrnT family toxin [Curvibacter sp.]|nr:MAG: BrnT family toxin [Curvibacter sp.]
MVELEYDLLKNEANIRDRGLSYEWVRQFDFESSLIWQDTRQHYSEARYIALGLIGSRAHVVVYAETDRGIRVISFRKANHREQRRYEQETQSRNG